MTPQRTDNQPIILVTGGAGYIGSQLIRDLADDPRFDSPIIRVYDSLRRDHYCGLMDLPEHGQYEFVQGDILDRLNLARAMQGVSTIVHLAAIVKTPLSFDHPEWTNQINHWGTASVVECALETGMNRLLYVSSASVYGPGGPFKETDDCRPIGPYASSKLGGEKSVRHSINRGLNNTIVRLATVYGNAPAMRFDGVANRFIFQVGVGRPMTIHGSGRQVRPLIHVKDASEVLRLCLSDENAIGETINAVTANPSVKDIADAVRQICPEAEARYTDQDILTEVSFAIDPSKLQNMGFKVQFTLQDGLKEMFTRWQSIRAASIAR